MQIREIKDENVRQGNERDERHAHKFPGAPNYRAYVKERQDESWRTVEHEAHLEYQSLLKDLMLESHYLGGQA